VCLSTPACPHYCTDPDVTSGNGRGCPLVVHCWADFQSVHGFPCCHSIARTRNVSECLYSLYAWCLLCAAGPSARDLSRMFPTPPSAEMPCSSISSPMQAVETAVAEGIAMDALHTHHFSSSTALLTASRDDSAGALGSLALLRKVRLLESAHE